MDGAPINSMIMQAVYILIFITATSITINLFNTINEYTENVSSVVRSDSISEVVSENEKLYDKDYNYIEMEYELSGYEVYSLANNYGMYINDSTYENGKKYNKEIELEYRIKVLNNSGNIINNINNIDLKASFIVNKLEEGYMELKQK